MCLPERKTKVVGNKNFLNSRQPLFTHFNLNVDLIHRLESFSLRFLPTHILSINLYTLKITMGSNKKIGLLAQ